jgi:hypothetical protein
MRLELSSESRVLVDLRAIGLLRAALHDPTLTARPQPAIIDLRAAEAIDTPVDLQFRAIDIEPPEDISSSDRDKMREHIRSRDVLDVAHCPTIDLRGRYAGNLEAGKLSGELWLRGAPRRVAMDIRISRDGERLVVRGAWEGRLTDLGIKPFRALLGALKLDDWIRLRLEALFSVRPHSDEASD